MAEVRVRAALVAIVVVAAGLLPAAARASTHNFATAAFKTVDSKLGFTFDVPDFLQTGATSGSNRVVLGSPDDDFAVVVSDFGADQTDVAARDAVYRAALLRAGLEVTTETDVTAAGRTLKRYVCKVDTSAGPGHAEAVLVSVSGRVYLLMVVTPATTVDARKAAITRIFESIRIA